MGGFATYEKDTEEGGFADDAPIGPEAGTQKGQGKPEPKHAPPPLSLLTYTHGKPVDPTKQTADEKDAAAHYKAQEESKKIDPATVYDGSYDTGDAYQGDPMGFEIEVKAEDYKFDPRHFFMLALAAGGLYYVLRK